MNLVIEELEWILSDCIAKGEVHSELAKQIAEAIKILSEV